MLHKAEYVSTLCWSTLFFFLLFRVTSSAYGGSQPRGRIGTAAASLHRSHSNAGSLTHSSRPGIEPVSSWTLVRFITAEPQRELQEFGFNHMNTASACSLENFTATNVGGRRRSSGLSPQLCHSVSRSCDLLLQPPLPRVWPGAPSVCRPPWPWPVIRLSLDA